MKSRFEEMGQYPAFQSFVYSPETAIILFIISEQVREID